MIPPENVDAPFPSPRLAGISYTGQQLEKIGNAITVVW